MTIDEAQNNLDAATAQMNTTRASHNILVQSILMLSEKARETEILKKRVEDLELQVKNSTNDAAA